MQYIYPCHPAHSLVSILYDLELLGQLNLTKSSEMMETKIILKTSVSYRHLAQLVAPEDFTE